MRLALVVLLASATFAAGGTLGGGPTRLLFEQGAPPCQLLPVAELLPAVGSNQ